MNIHYQLGLFVFNLLFYSIAIKFFDYETIPKKEKSMGSLYKDIKNALSKDQPFALAMIVSHKGSTPGTSGSWMLVRQDKTIAGTIGGGLVEAKVMNACVGMMDKAQSQIKAFHLDQALKAGMDMICGGSLGVWLRSFVPPFSKEFLNAFEIIAEIENKGESALVITRISGDTVQVPVVLKNSHNDPGASILPEDLLADAAGRAFSGPGLSCQVYGQDLYIIQPLIPRQTLYICGAGHVGYQLGQMAHITDFSTVIIDDRPEFADPARFPHARQVKIVPGFNPVFDGFNVDENSYIAILTRGHLYDQIVLEQALYTRAAYIGMIGSRKKRELIYGNLMDKGISKQALDAVYSPIGTAIKAQTPAELAVSILGELILVRATHKKS